MAKVGEFGAAEVVVVPACVLPKAMFAGRDFDAESMRPGKSSPGPVFDTESMRSGEATPGEATGQVFEGEAIAAREISVSSPLRPYFPNAIGGPLTKIDVVRYYAAVAVPLLTALRLRPTTLERWPRGVVEGATLTQRDGAKGDAFYQKRIPNGAPSWIETAHITFPSGRTADEVCPTEPAVFVWAANLGTITFHPWPVRRPDVDHPDELRIDLDPQPGADFGDAVDVALTAREIFAELGWTAFPKTSGGRGVHIDVRIETRWTFTDVRHAAIAFGRELERRMPGRVTTEWWKENRPDGTIFVDYNQNARDRTIASPWSVRSRPGATVSTPVAWDHLAGLDPRDYTVWTVPTWYAEQGDLRAAIDEVPHDLTPLLEWAERDAREGLDDKPYPPDYPKMPGEPLRVQPSRKATGKSADVVEP